MPHHFLDHTADVMFVAKGKTLSELFEQAGIALSEIIADISGVQAKKKILVDIEADSIENLLFAFLQEIIFHKDAEMMVFKSYNVNIREKDSIFNLHAEMCGERINPKKHNLGTDPKSVTYHQYYVKKIRDGWKTQVIVDI